MNKAIFEFEKVVRRVFREEAGAVLTSVSDQTLLYYISLPEVYESIYDFSFFKEDWAKKAGEINGFLQKVEKVKKWIENDFEWPERELPPIKFEVALNVSGLKNQIYRRNRNYLGVKVVKKKRDKKLFILVLDIDVGWVHYNKAMPELSASPYSVYEKFLINHFSTIRPDVRHKRTFVSQTKTVDKGKKTFIDLINGISLILQDARERCKQYVEFLDQPISDYSQLNKPVAVEGGIKREEMFQRWKKELEEAFNGMFGEGYQVVMLPDRNDPNQVCKVERMLDCTKKVRKLIRQVNSRVRMHLGGKGIDVKTTKKLTVSVPRFYSSWSNKSTCTIPFTEFLKATSGTEEFMKYLSGWEKFLEDLLLKTEVAKRQRKERKLML